MKSNYQSTLIQHLENRRPKCKMHTQERQLTRFFCILQLIYKENRQFFKTEPNPRFFLKTELNLKNPFCTSLEIIIETCCHLVFSVTCLFVIQGACEYVMLIISNSSHVAVLGKFKQRFIAIFTGLGFDSSILRFNLADCDWDLIQFNTRVIQFGPKRIWIQNCQL